MEDYTKWLKEKLYSSFFDWLTVNRKSIGERWYSQLRKQGQDAKADSRTLGGLMGEGLWMFNMIANLGVGAGVMIGDFNLQYLHNGIEEKSTKRLLLFISTTFCVQGLPMDILNKEIPIISPKHFSLELYVQQRKERGAIE